MKAAHVLYTCAFFAAIWFGCADEAPTQSLTQQCSLSSECANSLVCAFGKCHQACKTSRDCVKGEHCVESDKPNYVCQRQGCTRSSECLGKQICAIDAQCRDECFTQKDCLADQVCTGGVCADAQDLVGGTLTRATSAAGTARHCTLPTDCPGDLVCLRGGICGPECIVDRDCPMTYACKPLNAGGPGRCFPPVATPDAGIDGSPAIPGAVAVIAVGIDYACAVLVGGKLKCWGNNVDGRLGLGDTSARGDGPGEMGDALPYVDLGTGRTAKSVVAGLSHTCAILDNDRVKCWGENFGGHLGLGDAQNRGDNAGEMGDALPYVDLGTGRTAKALSIGRIHTCALLDNDRVKCWGEGAFGVLGLGDTLTRGDEAGEMGDALPYVDLGIGRTAKMIAAAHDHTCAVLDDDRVKCWGWNNLGQLGLGDVLPRGTGPGEMGDALPFVALGTGRTVTSLVAGRFHTCAGLDNNRIKCWGQNGHGELGLGDANARGFAATDMGDGLPYVDIGTGLVATSIQAGDLNTCVALNNGRAKCWGQNDHGELGLGDTMYRGDKPGEMGDPLPFIDLGANRSVKALGIGGLDTCALLDNDRIKCWGFNRYGAAGLGDTLTRGDGPGEMGDTLPYVELVAP